MLFLHPVRLPRAFIKKEIQSIIFLIYKFLFLSRNLFDYGHSMFIMIASYWRTAPLRTMPLLRQFCTINEVKLTPTPKEKLVFTWSWWIWEIVILFLLQTWCAIISFSLIILNWIYTFSIVSMTVENSFYFVRDSGRVRMSHRQRQASPDECMLIIRGRSFGRVTEKPGPDFLKKCS